MYILVKDAYDENIYGIINTDKYDEEEIKEIIHEVKEENEEDYSLEDIKDKLEEKGIEFDEDYEIVNF